MPNIKRYKIEHYWGASVTIDVDHDIATDAVLHEINNFWSSAEWRVEQYEGVLNAVLSMLARTIIYIQFAEGYGVSGLIRRFDWGLGNGQEGWPPMDGSHGFEIIDTEDLELDSDDMTITEESIPAA